MKAKRLLSLAIAILMLAGTATAQINKGYKGMVNAGWILLSEDVSFEALTIHGYQFNPHLFVGGGAGINYYCSTEENNGLDCGFIPIFADVRGYILKGRIQPYGEAKIGGLIEFNNGGAGLYLAPEIGCKFGLTSSFAIDLAVEYIVPTGTSVHSNSYYGVSSRKVGGGLCLKLGIEF